MTRRGREREGHASITRLTLSEQCITVLQGGRYWRVASSDILRGAHPAVPQVERAGRAPKMAWPGGTAWPPGCRSLMIKDVPTDGSDAAGDREPIVGRRGRVARGDARSAVLVGRLPADVLEVLVGHLGTPAPRVPG